MRKVTLALAAVAVFALSGCEKDEKYDNPVVKPLVTEVDGCVVKYVDRGLVSNSFYLARCPGLGDTVTTTGQTGGKGNSLMTAVTRTETEAERVAREQAERLAAQKKSALSKLTVEERRALGL